MAARQISSTEDTKSGFKNTVKDLSLQASDPVNDEPASSTAVRARFITPRDPVIETKAGDRLPPVPPSKATALNKFEQETKDGSSASDQRYVGGDTTAKGDAQAEDDSSPQSSGEDLTYRTSLPASCTHPLFPALPFYGPPSFFRNLKNWVFRVCSGCLSVGFLGIVVAGAMFTSIPQVFRRMGYKIVRKDPDVHRPFHEEEKRRQKVRADEAKAWKIKERQRRHKDSDTDVESGTKSHMEFEPTEGGPDPLRCDLPYYARRVGLDAELFEVRTEDDFLIDLWHLYNPKEKDASPTSQRGPRDPEVFGDANGTHPTSEAEPAKSTAGPHSRYPVLLIPGLLQSAGSYCSNDDDSLAFLLCKSGFDVWLGNNRCGFKPRHTLLKSSDPRMWNWNIRQMGCFDLPALVSRVLAETGFAKLGLVCHSQGTTQTFVALAKDQRPELGEKISVFCALAPAVYAGPLISKVYFKIMRIMSPAMFRSFFGIHSFIPFMLTMHWCVPGPLYGALGYQVFSFLFGWTDDRWDRGLRSRFFQCSPVYVSAESMRWWLGRDCFATQKCILSTREEWQREDAEDEQDHEEYYAQSSEQSTNRILSAEESRPSVDRGRNAWYNKQVPPFALWVAGSDQLVDGRRLLRRFEKGREPHVRVVHQSVIEEYEHLDVLWAVDAADKVGRELRETLWRSVPDDVRRHCQVPRGCADIAAFE